MTPEDRGWPSSILHLLSSKLTYSEADFFDVEILEKLTILQLVKEARFDDIGGFEFARALVRARADVDERLDRLVIQFRQRAQLRQIAVIHGIDGHALIAGKIFFQNRHALIPLGHEMMNCR